MGFTCFSWWLPPPRRLGAARIIEWRLVIVSGSDCGDCEGSCAFLKALVWFWLIDEALSANLVYQSDYEIGSTTPSDEEMAKIMMMMMAW